MTKSESGRLGALARMKIYGNPGTIEGRRKGGFNSLKINRKLKTNFKIAKKFKIPKESGLLAELVGILFGDGHLSDYQVLFTTNAETDMEHALYVKKLIRKLFTLDSSIIFKKKEKGVNVVVSSVTLVRWIANRGMPKGNKFAGEFCIPKWIKANKEFLKKFIKGVFDTDGCIYVDKHAVKGKVYRNQGLTITSYSNHLRNDIFTALNDLGYHPTLRDTQKSVYLRRKRDIQRYFKEIGTSNPKHLRRYKVGRVPKRS